MDRGSVGASECADALNGGQVPYEGRAGREGIAGWVTGGDPDQKHG